MQLSLGINSSVKFNDPQVRTAVSYLHGHDSVGCGAVVPILDPLLVRAHKLSFRRNIESHRCLQK